MCKKPEENKIQAHCQQRIENQGWMQNLKTAKQGAGCIQKELKTQGQQQSHCLRNGSKERGEGLHSSKGNETTALTYTQENHHAK